MNTPIKDYSQQKVTGGEQKVILDEQETAETDELDPKFHTRQPASETDANKKYEPGDDPKIELI